MRCCSATQAKTACDAGSQVLFGTDCFCPEVDRQRECNEQAHETQDSLHKQQNELTVSDFANDSQYQLEYDRLSDAQNGVYSPCYDVPDDNCQVAMHTAHGTGHGTRGMRTGHRAQWHFGT